MEGATKSLFRACLLLLAVRWRALCFDESFARENESWTSSYAASLAFLINAASNSRDSEKQLCWVKRESNLICFHLLFRHCLGTLPRPCICRLDVSSFPHLSTPLSAWEIISAFVPSLSGSWLLLFALLVPYAKCVVGFQGLPFCAKSITELQIRVILCVPSVFRELFFSKITQGKRRKRNFLPLKVMQIVRRGWNWIFGSCGAGGEAVL